jgi:hypothetical protein
LKSTRPLISIIFTFSKLRIVSMFVQTNFLSQTSQFDEYCTLVNRIAREKSKVWL